MKTFRVKLLSTQKTEFSEEMVDLCTLAGLRTCGIDSNSFRSGGLVLPDRIIITPTHKSPKRVKVAYQNDTECRAKLIGMDRCLNYYKAEFTPKVEEHGLDHTCVGDFLFSFVGELFVWEKLPHRREPYSETFSGAALPLFTKDKHFAGFVVWDKRKKNQPAMTEFEIEPPLEND